MNLNTLIILINFNNNCEYNVNIKYIIYNILQFFLRKV